MKRRKFIKSAIFASGALTIPFAGRSTEAGKSASAISATEIIFKKSIMWGTIGMEGSILDKCKAVKAAGYDGVEPNSHLNRAEMLDAINSTGLRASSVCCSTHWQKPLSSPDLNIRKEGIDGIRTALEDAKTYGTDTVLVVPGTVNQDVPYDECWERSTECLKKLLPIAQKLNVRIGIENVWNNFLLSPMEACRYIDQFNSPQIGFYFDCGNILVYGLPEQWIRILGKRILRIHVKEFSRSKADAEGRWKGFNVALTEGEVNWTEVMSESRKSYRGQWFTTEQGNSKTQDELSDLCRRLDNILKM
ncbi:MAG: sugar phosphate isomerase/epimerase [Prevotellaceae bacterium]|jgi:hexulose-6-phosphate isomerase|nr:sugar phosphate isomerase/epimerase [Prevotellaceae bacterium]